MPMTAQQLSPGPDAGPVELSVVLTADRRTRVAEALRLYRPALDALGRSYEVICVVDGTATGSLAELAALSRAWPELEVFPRRPWGGEDAELGTAFRRSRGALVLTLPPFLEIAPERLAELFERIGDSDMVIVNREDQPISGLQQRVLKAAFRLFFGHTVSDVFSRVRLSRRDVLEEVGGFGVRQHFIPVMAADRGYRVVEATVDRRAGPQRTIPHTPFLLRPVGYMSALIDAITLFVVLKFLRRPLRFFGAIGLPVLLVGLLLTSALVFGRLFLGMALADRPALIFGVLMVVLGIQIIAIGLVGEIIIFANSRHMKQYKVATILRRDRDAAEVQELAPGGD